MFLLFSAGTVKARINFFNGHISYLASSAEFQLGIFRASWLFYLFWVHCSYNYISERGAHAYTCCDILGFVFSSIKVRWGHGGAGRGIFYAPFILILASRILSFDVARVPDVCYTVGMWPVYTRVWSVSAWILLSLIHISYFLARIF